MSLRTLFIATLVLCATSGMRREAHAYTYIPTEQDRGEVRACIASAIPQTLAVDCVMPTVNRISASMMSELDAPGGPSPRPSQAFVMIQSAGMMCGMGADMRKAPSPAAKACLSAEARKVATAIAVGLRDALGSMN